MSTAIVSWESLAGFKAAFKYTLTFHRPRRISLIILAIQKRGLDSKDTEIMLGSKCDLKTLFLRFAYFDFMCLSVCLHICVYASYVCAAFKDQKKATDCLELKLQKAVSFHVAAGNPAQVLYKSSQSSSPQSHLSSLRNCSNSQNCEIFFLYVFSWCLALLYFNQQKSEMLNQISFVFTHG